MTHHQQFTTSVHKLISCYSFTVTPLPTWLPSFCQNMAGGGFPVVLHWKVMLFPWVAIWSLGFMAIWGGTGRGGKNTSLKVCTFSWDNVETLNHRKKYLESDFSKSAHCWVVPTETRLLSVRADSIWHLTQCIDRRLGRKQLVVQTLLKSMASIWLFYCSHLSQSLPRSGFGNIKHVW